MTTKTDNSEGAVNKVGPRILALDDDADALRIIGLMLKSAGYEVSALRHPEKLAAALASESPALVVTDIMMPGVTGEMVYRQIRATVGRLMPIIVSSGTKLRFRAPHDPLLAFCPKPVMMSQLLTTVNNLLEEAAWARKQQEESQGEANDSDWD
ncbi:hypothetical protein CVU37_02865 [candidate division BRC1 bacterium HGW-BRC1-1]|jgi:two-component system response regulator GlrR|nr:MAG: hypothetical protein CVU37_02865 [candidate division BRC1 bacterium HGW-BRC1-1]